MKKVFAILGVVVILCLTALPLFALSISINIDVILVSDSASGVTASISTNRGYSTGSIVTVYDTNPISLVYVGDEDLMSCSIKATLSENGRAEYTGYLVSITGTGGSNIIGSYTDLQPDSSGSYYIPNDTYFNITSDLQGTAPMVFTPVNINNAVDGNNYGYSAGYNDGIKYQKGIDEKRIAYLEQQIQALQASSPSADQLQAAFAQGASEAAATKTFVQDVVTTGVNGFTDVVQQFFNLQVLGISLYQIVLVACLIPLFVVVFKFVVHKNG